MRLDIRNAGLRALRNIALGLLLALAALPAWALGLGQIQVKSQPGQPLLAEIPIISSDPEELRGLQARLASPEVFRRIGLQPPQGIVGEIQFALAIGADGAPFIRVTTVQPVQQPALTFLVEVDWGQGRLVREYTALVDAPRTIAAPAQPLVEMPQVAPPAVIARPQAAPAPAAEPAPPPTLAEQPAAAAPARPFAPPPPPPAAVAGMQAEHRVERGQTLGEIASGHRGEASLDRMMVALLQANPDAFIGGDMNRLRTGAVLRMPRRDELQAIDDAQARALVREQVAAWRAARGMNARTAASAVSAATVATTSPPAVSTPPASRSVSSAAATAARLEIVPPGASDSSHAGTQSGLVAGGEGEMLRQELQETLAARDSEVTELKARVAELERLSQDQQRMISLKDEQLAQVQQTAASQDSSATVGIWWWAMPILLLVAAIVWLFSRRRAPAPSRGYLRQMPSAAARDEPPAPSRSDASRANDADAIAAAVAPAPAVSTGRDVPNWSTATREGTPSATPPAHADEVAATPAAAARDIGPAWHAGASAADNVAPVNPAPAGNERLELARAYLDLGDTRTARSLLQEVVASGHPQAGVEAQRLLDTLS